MEGNVTATVGLVGGSYALFTAMMTLRQEIDDKRNMALGFDKSGREIHKDLRLYILCKDVRERWWAMIALMVSTGITFAGAAIYVWEWNIMDVDPYLTCVIAVFGLLCLLSSVAIWVLGRRDLKDWREYVVSGN